MRAPQGPMTWQPVHDHANPGTDTILAGCAEHHFHSYFARLQKRNRQAWRDLFLLLQHELEYC